MSRKPTQADTFEIYGMSIANPSERLAELERRGHIIRSDRERCKPDHAFGARYTLVRDAGSADGDDRDALLVGGPTDLADIPAGDWEAAGGSQLVHAAEAPSEQDRPADARVDTPASTSPLPGAGGQLFPDTIVEHTSRPHWMDEAA